MNVCAAQSPLLCNYATRSWHVVDMIGRLKKCSSELRDEEVGEYLLQKWSEESLSESEFHTDRPLVDMVKRCEQ
jgi:hypothetical protein